MTEKRGIIEELGEEGLLLPTLVNNALLANDRIKYYFTLLQTAADHAAHPDQEYPTLRTERETAAIESPGLDTVIAGSHMPDESGYFIPMLPEIIAALVTCMDEMLAPFIASGPGSGEDFVLRHNVLVGKFPSGKEGRLEMGVLRMITSGNRDEGDSIHLLVMDLHKALNGLQGTLSTGTIDGAMTYMLGGGDDRLVQSFMAGVHRTAPLKFNHPGLGTTATRTGSKLVIQNDIGMTDAHVLVIHVEGMTVSVIYTDNHMQRLQFFQSIFDKKKVRWQDTVSRRSGQASDAGVYHLSTGTYSAADAGDLGDFLEFLGSRLVFLIDWNRARKQLRNFLLNKDCIAVLKSAADNDFGHMGFLELGGDKIIYAALDLAATAPLRYGEPLHQLLGRERTTEYMAWVLRTASEGLFRKQSRLLLQDEIKTELLRNFRSAHEGMMDYCVEHAYLLVEVGSVVQDSIIRAGQEDGTGQIDRNAQRAKDWEHAADQLVSQVRTLSRRMEEAEFFSGFIHIADDALDYLEEASFRTTMLTSVPFSKQVNVQLAAMADIAARESREYVKALMAAQTIHRGNSRDEMQDFLTAFSQIIALEHECDEALREFEKTVFLSSGNFQEFHVYFSLACEIEESTNSMMNAVYRLHDYILEGMNR